MTHHCTICRTMVNTNCVRLGHIKQCSHCERFWVPSREPECPYCANARVKEEQRLNKEKEKEAKGKGKNNSSSKRKDSDE